MALLTLQLSGHKVQAEWNSLQSNSVTTNLFLAGAGSQANALGTETSGQMTMAVGFQLWRILGGYVAAGTQTSTMTARVNGVSQSLAITVGTAAGMIISDLATAIAVKSTDQLGILWKFTVADANAQRPRCLLVGIADGSL